MGEKKSHDTPPFKTLGTHLKYLREQNHQSLAEVSGAVEIDSEVLARIEQGFERPSEDILLLLINHFDMQDQEAVQLWELAGYGDPASRRHNEMPLNNKQIVMLLAMDMRTMYSDGLDINVNQAGMTLNFTQATDGDKRIPVARVGLSYEQAQHVVKTLQEALIKGWHLRHPRQLPPGADGEA